MVATKLVTAERRWVVSGTPAKDRMIGVDVEMAGNVYGPTHGADPDLISTLSRSAQYEESLDGQKSYNKNEEKDGASRSIGILLANFLQIRPWAGTDYEQKVTWEGKVHA